MRKEKKRRGKRWLASVLAAALVFGAVSAGPPVSVKAAETEEGTGTETDVGVIPDGVIVAGNRVTDGRNFTGTTLDLRGTGITGIGDQAFRYNENLVTVYLPDTLESIGELAFSGCSVLNKVDLQGNTKLKNIGDSAFYNCGNMTEFSLPKSVESIRDRAFSGCSSLKQFKIEENSSLQVIGKYAFRSCKALTEFIIPETVESIGELAFDGCSALNRVEFKGDCKLKSIERSVFSSCGMTEFIMPDSVESIESSAFGGCSVLNRVVFTENSKLKSIGQSAFSSCSALNRVVFEGSPELETIGSSAFSSCGKLTEFSLPDSVESIGSGAFYNCSSLKQFNIGEYSSLKTIEGGAFRYCSALTGEICFPASLDSVGDNALYNSNLSVVKFKNYNTKLGDSIFYHSNNLDENVVFYSEPRGSVEKYARDNGFRFQRPASSFTVTLSRGESLDFSYGADINAAVLQQAGVTASAKFSTKPDEPNEPDEYDVNLSDCLLSGFNTKEVGENKQKIYFEYSGHKESIPINVYYDMSTARVSTIYSQTYTGSEIKPGFTVTLKAGTNLTLIEGTDYTVEWKDNVNVGTATVTLTGKGFYKGTKEVTFDIKQQSIESVMDVRVESETVEYTGKAVEPGVTVTLGSKTLVKDTDYTLTYTDNIGPGTAKVTVSCKGNYNGSVTKNFKIIRDISKDMEITIKKAGSLEYTGEMIKPEILVMLDGEVLDSYYDYTVSYKNNILPGENTASVIVTGKGLYSGSQEKKFTIRPKDIQDTMTVNLAQTSVTYTGAEQKPKVTVYESDSYYADVLKEGTDYILTYADNTDVGTASVTVTCTGLYAGEVVKEFTITPFDISEKAEVSLGEEEMAYTGEKLEPETAVTLGKDELVKDRDFKVQYKNNIQAGTAEVVVTGKGNYSGTVTKSFRIFNDINGEMKVAFVEDELEFTGKPIVPSFTVSWNGTVLMPQEDFDVSYQNNTNVGLAQVKVTCKGKYRGEAVASFTITKRDITDDIDCVLSYDEAVATGKALTPGVTVRLGNRTLVRDEDYTVKYADNVNPGTATVTVTAKGNYEGTAVLSFTIHKPATPKPTETAKPTASPEPDETAKPTASPEPDETTKPTASPKPDETAKPTTPEPTGTEKPTATPGASETEKPTATPGASQPGTSQPETPTAPPAAGDADDVDSDDENEVKSEKVKNLKAKNDKKKSLTLTWKNVRNAKSYQIQYSTSKKFKGSKTKVSNKAKATLKGLKKKKTYYIRVRACTVSDGKKVYGAWSAVQKVKIKK